GLAVVDLVFLQQGLLHVVALRRQHRVAHAAADDDLVCLISQRFNHTQLVGYLRAAENNYVWVCRFRCNGREHVELRLHELAGIRRKQLSYIVDRCLRAVTTPKPSEINAPSSAAKSASSCANAARSASSFEVSRASKRTFSMSMTSPSLRPLARSWASSPVTSPASATYWSKASLKASATGAREYFSLNSP